MKIIKVIKDIKILIDSHIAESGFYMKPAFGVNIFKCK